MKRYHIKPKQCGTCGFRGDAGQVKDHEKTSCQSKRFDPVSPEDQKREELLKKRAPWCEIFENQMGSDVSNYPEAEKCRLAI